MSAGKDSGLDIPNWQEVDLSTATTEKRESTTGVEAQIRNSRTYLQVIFPKTKKNTTKEGIPKNLGKLTLLCACHKR